MLELKSDTADSRVQRGEGHYGHHYRSHYPARMRNGDRTGEQTCPYDIAEDVQQLFISSARTCRG